ncbi:carbon-nitrogen hydrolase family protein [Rhodobacteraceae bacterium N5(2021)]|uniref:Carbon-nitrogen hydrolase family protein n=1 Tax=Gymnodinialimonas phycosphaerae TaxID=2841589 RepID=A0A975TZ96_9RHOB|nr:carbon-nitrogen hydrolase family protein [Gymnodinialimonas phycosphaerae]MBY4892720.1 carbon-nitrogen hydrolase family protein [Gymnodinialimonas phycosphaerae]
MKIATAAYPLDLLPDFPAYAEKQIAWVREAAGQGADLLVFPEYGRMELAGLVGAAAAGDLEASLHAAASYAEDADALTASLAEGYGVHILAPSGPVFHEGAERPTNQASLFGPEGYLGQQDKQIMTRFEREHWNVVPGEPLAVIDTALGRIGILICYDAEFPLLGRALIDQGAEIILCPSCTDSLAGYSRVRIGAMARALEGQCITVQSPTVGAAKWSPAVDENVGIAGVYGPPDLGFPATGIVAEGALNTPGWTYAEVDIAAVHRVRAEGSVFNHAHWPESAAAAKIAENGDLP